MPQKRPPYQPDHYYHIYNRGRSRLPIFLEHDNYLFVLQKIKKYLPILELKMITYCLMPNHYHFLIFQGGEQRAGLLAQRVFNSYSKAYNKRYEHTGTLFEGHYQVRLIEDDNHLIHLCRYIHGNPVKDGLVAAPEDWPYSNYLEWIGQRKGSIYDSTFVQENFSSSAAYRNFVLDDLEGRTLPDEIKTYLN